MKKPAKNVRRQLGKKSRKQLVALRQRTAKAQHKQVKGVLRESEEGYRALVETAPDVVYIISDKGVLISLNPAFETITGWSRTEWLGKPFAPLVHPEDASLAVETFQKVLRGNRLPPYELRILSKSGEYLVGEFTSSPYIKDDKVVGELGIVRDITERRQAEKELRESRELYWAMFSSCPQGVLMVDTETQRFLYVNPAICQMLGYTEAELLQLGVADIHPAEALARVEGEFAALARAEKILAEAIPCRRKDGTVLFTDITASPLRITGWKQHVMMGFFTDVTERKEADRALRESEEKFRLLAEQSPNMIFINQNGRVVYANAKCAELTGYPKQDFYSPAFDFLSLIAPDCVKAVQHTFGKHLKGEEVPPYECGLVTKEGRRIEIIVTTKLVQYDGKSAILGIVTEITERKRIEEAREQSISLLRATLESTADGILVVDNNETIVGFNERFIQLWHIPKTMIVSRNDAPVLAFVTEQLKDSEQFLAKVKRLYTQPEAEDFDVLKLKDGRTFERYSIPQRIGGRPVGRVWSFRDVTERKQAEELLRVEMDRLDRASTAGNIALWEWDMTTGRMEWSGIVDSMLGYEPGTFPRTLQMWEKTIHPDDRDLESRVLAKHLEENAPYDVEYRVRRKDGSYIWWHDMGACRRDEQGKAYQMSGVCIDVTERKLAEAALRESEERYRRLFEGITDGVFVHEIMDDGMPGQFLAINDTFCQRMGYTREELMHMTVCDIDAPESTLNRPKITERLKRDKKLLFQQTHVAKDGHRIPVEINAQLSQLQDRPVILSVIRDITERKQVEEAKRKDEERLQKINQCILGLGIDHNSNINRLTALCGELLGADCALYNRLQDGLLCAVGQWQTPPDFKANGIPEGHICYDVIKSNKDDGIVISDLPHTPYASSDPNVLAYGLRTYMGYAVRSEGKSVGSLCVAYKTDCLPTDDDRRILGIIASAVGNEDMHAQAEDTLRQSEERYRQLFELESDAVVQLDCKTGQVLQANAAAIALYGYSRDEWLRLKHIDVSLEPEKTLEVASKELTQVSTRLHRKKDGTVFPVEVTCSFYDWQGRRVELAAIRDITVRREMEEYVTKLSSLKQQLLGTGDINKKFKLITDGVVEIFGADFARIWLIRKADLCEESCLHATATEGPNVCRNRIDCLHLIASSGRYTQIDGSHRRVPFGCYKIGRVASGEDVGFITNDVINDPRVHDHEWAKSLGLVSFAGFRLVSREGKPIGVLALFSKQKISLEIERLFEDLANATSQVIIAGNMEEERHKLEVQMQQAQKLESLGILAGGIAHDFNNLLTVILGHANLALADLSPESPARENLLEIDDASRRAAELCRQMLAYSGRGSFVVKPINLSRLVQELIHMLQVSISKKAMLRCDFAENLPSIDADPAQIRQVIMNLVINASEAIGSKEGIISISTDSMQCNQTYLSENHPIKPPPPGKYVYVEVSDTGCGMDPKTRAKIFDPFFTTKFTGRGLGLAAVIGIMQQHKGAIKITSEPGKGSTFRVLFPISSNTDIQPEAETPPKLWRGSGTVLVVDDEAEVLNVAKIMLEHYGFSVISATDGREAIKLFQKHGKNIVCVLLDMTMPHMDGEETYQELRRIRKDVRVIIASGYSEQEITKRFAGHQLAGFVEKPYEATALMAKMRDALGEP